MIFHLCGHDPPTSQTDIQTTSDSKTALCTAVHRAVKSQHVCRFQIPLLLSCWKPVFDKKMVTRSQTSVGGRLFVCVRCFDAVGWPAGRASGFWKLSGGMLAWLSVWGRFAYSPADATATQHPCSSKSRLVLPFGYRLTRITRRAVNGCCCCCWPGCGCDGHTGAPMHRLSKIGRTWGVWREPESSLDPKMTKHNF